ncbi:hypothetical protein BH11PSE13_BH11PSE13_43420 [soil metagenome]
MTAPFARPLALCADSASRARYWPTKSTVITEPFAWYTREHGAESPWGRAIIPMAMISVLLGSSSAASGLSESARTESVWIRTRVSDGTRASRPMVAEMILNEAVMMASYPAYELEAKALYD